MSTASAYDLIGSFQVPAPVMSLDAFRAWAASSDFPERGKVTYYNGRLIFDMSPQKYYTHLAVLDAINSSIGVLVRELDLGRYFPDGGWITHDDAAVSNEPDAMFVSWKSFESGRFAMREGDEEDTLEMTGPPDWVCEVLSDSSVEKDTKVLREAYFKAGIPEYWLIDARGEEIDFKLLVAGAEGYGEAPATADGWRRSPVFGREFHLSRDRDRVNRWRYCLSHR
ncbi:MAG: Uma2 family endonuclease [Planctomycetota bacterium]